MHRIFRVKAYEKEHGPHFNEEYARKAVMKMENEDGTRGPHWSLEETTTLASQYGIALDGIKCKLPNTVSVPYPQLSVYNPEIFRAAAYGAFAGDTYANYGLSSQCGC
jgi:hypothetical protein